MASGSNAVHAMTLGLETTTLIKEWEVRGSQPGLEFGLAIRGARRVVFLFPETSKYVSAQRDVAIEYVAQRGVYRSRETYPILFGAFLGIYSLIPFVSLLTLSACAKSPHLTLQLLTVNL